MKDWLTLIIVILIIGIILDGLRRMRIARRENLRLSKNAIKADMEGDLPVSSSEFPSGGARVAAVRAEADAKGLNATVRKTFASSRVTAGAAQRIPTQVSLNLEQAVPMLMDSLDHSEDDTPVHNPKPHQRTPKTKNSLPDRDSNEPSIGSLDDLNDDEVTSSARTSVLSASSNPSLASVSQVDAEDESELPASQAEVDYADDYAPDEYESDKRADDYGDELEEQEQNTEQPIATEAEQPSYQNNKSQDLDNKPRFKEPDEVLIFNVMAKHGQRFHGADLLAVLMEEGMKFGDMDIFHRHLDNDGDGPILFSLANMVVPGTFNLAAMDEFQTPGVSIFLSLPVACESLVAYNDLAKTAKSIAEKLGGELKDENRSVMTAQTIEHGRQRVIEYERKKKLAHA